MDVARAVEGKGRAVRGSEGAGLGAVAEVSMSWVREAGTAVQP